MRIAYFVNQYPKVSHSFIRREILALENSGIDVERFALRGWDAQVVDAEDAFERNRTGYVLGRGIVALVPAAVFSFLAQPARWLSALGLAFRMSVKSLRRLPFHLAYFLEACTLAKWMDDFDADHLHAHFGTNSAEVAMLAGVISGKPYSFTVHGPEEFDQPEYIGLAEKVRRSAFTVAISSYGRSQMYRWIDPADWDKIKVVHCGIEPAFHHVEAAPFPTGPRLVCVGRLCEQKGQLLLLQAARILMCKGVPFELVLAGDGELRERIEANIATLGLTGKVWVTGWISGAEVREQLLAARALVLPSFAEGLPVVIMEAMSLRRPVLTTYIAGIPELVQSGETGWLFPSGSIDDLASAMEECLAAPTEALACMGEKARRRVLERHDSDREAAKLAVHFREAIRPRVVVLASQA